MMNIKYAIADLYLKKITTEEAVKRIAHYNTAEELAEMLVDTFNRGWITPFNLGINEDGEVT